MRSGLFLGIAGSVLLVGCTKSQPAQLTPEQASVKLIDQGKVVYLTNCITCHNTDPRYDGSVGPALAGSSAELIALRVSKAAYPPGYKPKRPTQVMPAFPLLEKDAPALAAYLGSVK